MKFSLLDQSKEIKDLIFNYPSFVHSKRKSYLENEIPVFVFHSIDPVTFELQLKYLKSNDYSTLSIEEFKSSLAKNAIFKKTVLLTIDDARLSFWKYAFPLLKKYNMKATLFVIPGRTLDNQTVRYNQEDVWDETITESQLESIDPNDEELCNWQELEAIHKSKLINIESHTLFHREVFTSKKLLGVINKYSNFSKFNSDISPYLNKNCIGKDLDENNYYGYPLFETESLMLGNDHYSIDSKLLEFCKDFYMESNTKDVSLDKSLLDILKRELHTNKYDFEIINGKDSVKEDLILARNLIKDKLGDNAGNSICLPWTLGNELTIEILKEINIDLCFWGTLSSKKINKPGDDLLYISRLKSDFIFRLPGIGRESLTTIYLNKFKRRIENKPVY